MWWKSLVVALLVLPPVAYVAGTLRAPAPTPEQRPALVLDGGSGPTAAAEPEVTLNPRPQKPPTRGTDAPGDDRDDRDDRDERDDGEDDSDDRATDLTVVRPEPQQAGDDDDAQVDDDDDDDGDDSRDDDSRDDSD